MTGVQTCALPISESAYVLAHNQHGVIAFLGNTAAQAANPIWYVMPEFGAATKIGEFFGSHAIDAIGERGAKALSGFVAQGVSSGATNALIGGAIGVERAYSQGDTDWLDAAKTVGENAAVMGAYGFVFGGAVGGVREWVHPKAIDLEGVIKGTAPAEDVQQFVAGEGTVEQRAVLNSKEGLAAREAVAKAAVDPHLGVQSEAATSLKALADVVPDLGVHPGAPEISTQEVPKIPVSEQTTGIKLKTPPPLPEVKAGEAPVNPHLFNAEDYVKQAQKRLDDLPPEESFQRDVAKADLAEVKAYKDRIAYITDMGDRKSTRLNSSHIPLSRMPSSA